MSGTQAPPVAGDRPLASRSEVETAAVGEKLAGSLAPGDTVLLEGGLGAGKTVFARGVARGLGVDPLDVRSPTFTLVNLYRGRVPVYHVDLYRVESEADLSELGLEEWIGTDGVALVEWAERLQAIQPSRWVRVRIEDEGGDQRKIFIHDGRVPGTEASER